MEDPNYVNYDNIGSQLRDVCASKTHIIHCNIHGALVYGLFLRSRRLHNLVTDQIKIEVVNVGFSGIGISFNMAFTSTAPGLKTLLTQSSRQVSGEWQNIL
jgi:hypothetical protein